MERCVKSLYDVRYWEVGCVDAFGTSECNKGQVVYLCIPTINYKDNIEKKC